jgi:hypothetical protein
LLVVDDLSRYMWLEVLRSKDETFTHFCKIKARAEAEKRCKLLTFHSYRGGEFKSFCDENGIKHFTTAPYSPQ